MKTVLAVLLIVVSSASAFSGADVDQGKVPVTTSSESARTEFLIGQHLSDNLQATKSLEHYDKAVAIDPQFASAYLARAVNSLTTPEFLSNLEKAVQAKDRVSEGERLLILAADAGAKVSFKKQQGYLEHLVELYPNDERARFTLGSFYFGQQDYALALQQFEKAVSLAPEFPPDYNILGYTYRQVEQYDKAEQAFKKYTQLVPDDANPYDSYAELLMKIGRFDESIANYRKALAVDSTFTSSEIGITMDYLYQGKADLASREANRLHTMARNAGEERQAFFVQAVVASDGGNFAEAVRSFDKEYAVGKRINDVVGMAGDLAAKGSVYLEMGKLDDALASFRASNATMTSGNISPELKNNSNVVVHYNETKVALARGDFKKAKEEADAYRVGAEKSKNPNQLRFVHELQGPIALAEKNGAKAVGELLKASLQDPYNLYRLSLAYSLIGDNSHAKEYAKKAAEFHGLPSLNYAFVRAKATKLYSNQ